MDADNDGTVTIAEMDIALKTVPRKEPKSTDPSSDEKIEVVDKNGDGLLSAEEPAAGSKRMFSAMDVDRDGLPSRTHRRS